MKTYMVSAVTGQTGGLMVHRFKVREPTQAIAKRRIRQSTLATAWDGERMRSFEASLWQPWMDEVGGVKDLTA